MVGRRCAPRVGRRVRIGLSSGEGRGTRLRRRARTRRRLERRWIVNCAGRRMITTRGSSRGGTRRWFRVVWMIRGRMHAPRAGGGRHLERLRDARRGASSGRTPRTGRRLSLMRRRKSGSSCERVDACEKLSLQVRRRNRVTVTRASRARRRRLRTSTRWTPPRRNRRRWITKCSRRFVKND